MIGSSCDLHYTHAISENVSNSAFVQLLYVTEYVAVKFNMKNGIQMLDIGSQPVLSRLFLSLALLSVSLH